MLVLRLGFFRNTMSPRIKLAKTVNMVTAISIINL